MKVSGIYRMLFLAVVLSTTLTNTADIGILTPTRRNFNQRIDHFNQTAINPGFFKQRFLYNDSYATKAGQPILFYCGGETSIDTSWQASGFLFYLAKVFNASVLFAEHRYYGDSLPFNTDVGDTFTQPYVNFLTAKQALADYGNLLGWVKSWSKFADSPVIAFGASYAGMLAAYARSTYPRLIAGAIASSAPVKLVNGLGLPHAFFEIATKAYKVSDPSCADQIKEAFRLAQELARKQPDGLTQLSSKFRLCSNLSTPNDVEWALKWARTALTDLASGNRARSVGRKSTSPVAQVCKTMLAATDDLVSGLGLVVGRFYAGELDEQGKCNNYKKQFVECSDITGCGIGPDWYGWDYQACTEFGIYDGSNSTTDDMFPSLPLTKERVGRECRQRYDIKAPVYDRYNGIYGSDSVVGMKRPATDDISYPNSGKRVMVLDKVAAAAEAAARLDQKLTGAVPPTSSQIAPSLTPTSTESISIPDRYVGLVIGKKGEQIMSSQAESACKVQISQAGTPERTVTLTETEQQMEHAKRLISEIIEKAEKNGPVAPSVYSSGDEVSTVEMMIPGMKAGLIIGRSGVTIKRLQEENNIKMVVIQQSNQASNEDKPLRISGEQVNVEKARMVIMNLLNTRDTRTGGPMQGYGEETGQCAVPADKAGLVIGKGGALIKEICSTSGAHVEISKDAPPDPDIKLFSVRGSRMAIDQAVRMICDRAGIPVSQSTVNNASGGSWGQYGYPQSDPWGMGGTNGAPQAAVPQAGVPTPSLNPCTGQLDYSAAWADYYRKHGMNEFADAIMRNVPQPGAQTAQVQPNMVPNQPIAPSQPPSQMPVQGGQPQQGQQFDYNQWQWQQWQAWQQAWQQQAGGPGQPSGYPPQASSMPSGRPHMPEQ